MDIDAFVNGNAANVDLQARFDQLVEQQGMDGDAAMFGVLPGEFRFGLAPAEELEDAFPVLVYHRGGQLVGWYDCENLVGYVAG
jgi:hypothetical protein